jgi:hypothetical protein
MKQDNLVTRILQDAQTINKLNDDIRQANKEAGKPVFRRSGSEASRLFDESYNDLAFPGGLEQGLALLAQQDPDTIATAIAYLVADPHYFRSGYIKKGIMHLLKNAALTVPQIQRLQEVLVKALTNDSRFYMECCRLARKIQDPKFQEKIQSIIAQSHDKREVYRARKMLKSMRS